MSYKICRLSPLNTNIAIQGGYKIKVNIWIINIGDKVEFSRLVEKKIKRFNARQITCHSVNLNLRFTDCLVGPLRVELKHFMHQLYRLKTNFKSLFWSSVRAAWSKKPGVKRNGSDGRLP